MTNIRTKISAYMELLKLTLKEASRHNESLPRAVFRLVQLLTVEEFSVREIKAYAPHLEFYRARLPVVISKQRTLKMLARINPADLAWKTEDKHLFHAHCKEHDLPTPKHLFTSNSNDQRCHDWMALNEKDAMDRLPAEFIIKPRHGAYGLGFRAFRQVDGQLFEDEQSLSLDAFREAISQSGRQMIVQERAYDHEDLAELSGTHALQTVRYVTFKDGQSAVRPLYFAVFLMREGNTVSNFAYGSTGNCVAFGNLETGVLKGAIVGNSNRLGLESVEQHPGSGQKIEGFQVPFWDEVQRLASRAHESLDDFTAIGWDIAITPLGPVVLEGNVRFDPPNHAPWIMQTEDWKMLYT